jgi:hypothetical protein
MTSRPTGGRVLPLLCRRDPAIVVTHRRSTVTKPVSRFATASGELCNQRLEAFGWTRPLRPEAGAERTEPPGITSGTCDASILMRRASRVKDRFSRVRSLASGVRRHQRKVQGRFSAGVTIQIKRADQDGPPVSVSYFTLRRAVIPRAVIPRESRRRDR